MKTQDLRERAEQAAEAARRFNARPPTWFYIVAGVVIVLVFQILRHL